MVKGLTINDIMNISYTDINKMDRKELAYHTSRLASAGNKRLRRLEKGGKASSSKPYEQVSKVGDFSVKGKDVNQLRKEFARVKKFLRTETGSLSGLKKVERNLEKRLNTKFKDEQQVKEFWEVYKKVEEGQEYFIQQYGSKELQKLIAQYQVNNPNKSIDDVINFGKEQVDKFYNDTIQKNNDYESTNNFYDIF